MNDPEREEAVRRALEALRRLGYEVDAKPPLFLVHGVRSPAPLGEKARKEALAELRRVWREQFPGYADELRRRRPKTGLKIKP